MITVAFCTQKGGTGKTTIATALAISSLQATFCPVSPKLGAGDLASLESLLGHAAKVSGAGSALPEVAAAAVRVPVPLSCGQVTVSVGYAAVGEHDYPATVLDRADKALYFAKNHGRNRVCNYESLRAGGALEGGAGPGSVDLF